MSIVCHLDFDSLGPNLRGALQRPRPAQTCWGPETTAGKRILEELETEPGGHKGSDNDGSKEERDRKKRRSRWEPHVEKAIPGLPGISLPPSLAGIVDVNLEVLDLQRELNSINDKIQFLSSGRPLELKREEGRSPSPEPMYNPEGIRVNTREQRLKEKMIRERQRVIQELIMKNPHYKPPSDFRPEKKTRKIYIPVNENPGYNFIGLIIGPRGNTQKRMEKATGTKIAIRGKGSLKEGRVRKEFRLDTSEDEPLHVLIAGDTEEAVDKAAEMITKLLVPMDEVSNEHKRNQLRELAELNGTLRDFEQWDKRDEDLGIYKLPERVKVRADQQYQKDLASVNPEEAGKMENEFQSFMRELGGNEHMPRGSSDGRNVQDPTNLYVGFIPSHLTDSDLEALFSQCGEVVHCQIIHDRQTGQSRGFGFVKMQDHEAAERAIQQLHDHHIDKRRLVVRYKGEGPPPTRSSSYERRNSGQSNPKSPTEKPTQVMVATQQAPGPTSEGQWDVEPLTDDRPPGVDEPFSLPASDQCPPLPPPLPVGIPQWIAPQPDPMFAGYPPIPPQGGMLEAFEPRPPGEEPEPPGMVAEPCAFVSGEGTYDQSYCPQPDSDISNVKNHESQVHHGAPRDGMGKGEGDKLDAMGSRVVQNEDDDPNLGGVLHGDMGEEGQVCIEDSGKVKVASNGGKKKSEKGSKKSKSSEKKRKSKLAAQEHAIDLEEGEIPAEPGEVGGGEKRGQKDRRRNGHRQERGMRSDQVDEKHCRHKRDSSPERRRFESSHGSRRWY